MRWNARGVAGAGPAHHRHQHAADGRVRPDRRGARAAAARNLPILVLTTESSDEKKQRARSGRRDRLDRQALPPRQARRRHPARAALIPIQETDRDVPTAHHLPAGRPGPRRRYHGDPRDPRMVAGDAAAQRARPCPRRRQPARRRAAGARPALPARLGHDRSDARATSSSSSASASSCRASSSMPSTTSSPWRRRTCSRCRKWATPMPRASSKGLATIEQRMILVLALDRLVDTVALADAA